MLGGPVTSFPVTCARFLEVDSKFEVLAGKLPLQALGDALEQLEQTVFQRW